MKKIIILLAVFAIFACNDDFLERFPETDITEANFFKTAKDLEIFSNGFYNIGLDAPYDDVGSDNIGTRDADDDTWDLIHGAVSELTMEGWYKSDWEQLREINFFLANTHKAVSAGDDVIAHYEALGRFFRAQFYIDKVKTFSDVPWYSKAIATNETDQLFKAQDPRGNVVDEIIKDLQFASNNLSISNNSKTRISKYAALASLSRFALYESTFRKYGLINATESAYLTKKNASDYNTLLEIARDASQQIMDEGGFSLSGDYAGLFNSNDLSGNSEIILFEDFASSIREHNSYLGLDYQVGLNQSLIDEYLKIDGTAYTKEELKTLNFIDTFKDRDSRLRATVAYPGFTVPGNERERVTKIALGGYGQIKYTPKDPDGWNWAKSYNDLPVFRYAEVLLINAEAHAELGTLTDAILSNTVNALRSRAGLSGADVTMGATIDPILAAEYPNIQATPKGAALEIRRERRIEMACEGLRFDDLMRWHLGDALLTLDGKPENLPRGLYVPQLTMLGGAKFSLLEVTGDDEEDIIIAETAADLGLASEYYDSIGESDFYSSLNKFSLDDVRFLLENGDEGHIKWIRDVDEPGTFVEPKYYYRPLPQSETLINTNLTQHEFWN